MLLLRHVDCTGLRTLTGSGIVLHEVSSMCSGFHACVSIGPSDGHPSITCFDVRCNLDRMLGVCSNNLNMLTNSCLGRTSSDGTSLYTVNFLCHCNCFARALSVSNRRVTGCRTRGFNRLPVSHMLSRGNRRVMISIPCLSCCIRTCI